jgi:hypothetical protein
MDWFEDLPEKCPPPESYQPQEENFYRLGSNPPVEENFFSHRKISPEKIFHVSECIAHSLSLLNTFDAAIQYRALPTLKNKSLSIIKITLKSEHGQVQQTTKNQNHFSWWRTNSFDITQCSVLPE